MRRTHIALLVALASACATGAPAPAPGRSTVEGTLRLVPHEGVEPGSSSSSPYASRALRDTRFVDYTHPGFAVVYLEGHAAPGGEAELSIRASKLQTRLEPAELATGAGATLRIRNETDQPHVLSFPAASRVQKLAPRETVELPIAAAGAQEVFLLDVPGAEAALFAAPGPFAAVASDGRFEIRDVEPGRVRATVWHARFPPASQWLELTPGGVARLEFEIGVGRPETADETP